MADDRIYGMIRILHVNPDHPPYAHWVMYKANSYRNLTLAQLTMETDRDIKIVEEDPILHCTTEIAGEFSFYERIRDEDKLERYCSVCAPTLQRGNNE